MIAPADNAIGALDLLMFALMALIVILGIMAADDQPPTDTEWGTGIMCPAAPRPARFPCEASWSWDRPVP